MFKKFGLSGTALKIIACLSMLIDHTAAMLGFGYGLENLGMNHPQFAYYYVLARGIGRVAFPVFAFLVVEGFLHTRDVKKYLMRMFLFAIISQIPYNLLFGHRIFYTERFLPAFIFGNVFWTFSLGIIVMWIFKKIEEKNFSVILKYLSFVIVIAAAGAIAYVIKCDRKHFGILVIALFYIFRDKRIKQLLTTIISYRDQSLYSYISLIPIALYNGKRGAGFKYFFYLFYPIHMLVLVLIRAMIF